MSHDVVICLPASSGYDRAAQGVAGAGRTLADELGGSLCAVIVGAADDQMLADVAAVTDAVTVADQPELVDYQPESCLAALEQSCRRLEPAAVLLGSDTAGLELTPRLAARLGGSPMSDGIGLRDAIFVYLFGAYGVATESAVAFSWIALGMLLVQGVVGGIVFLLRRGFGPARA